VPNRNSAGETIARLCAAARPRSPFETSITPHSRLHHPGALRHSASPRSARSLRQHPRCVNSHTGTPAALPACAAKADGRSTDARDPMCVHHLNLAESLQSPCSLLAAVCQTSFAAARERGFAVPFAAMNACVRGLMRRPDSSKTRKAIGGGTCTRVHGEQAPLAAFGATFVCTPVHRSVPRRIKLATVK
jgi:hypothetical protein